MDKNLEDDIPTVKSFAKGSRRLVSVKRKQRSPWYSESYNQLNSTAIPGSLPNLILHRFLERGIPPKNYLKILEIGANNGEHIEFVKHFYDEYFVTDLALSAALIEKISHNSKLKMLEADAHALPFKDLSFDRVLSTCVLHHLEDPELALRECLRVTKIGGVITIILPNDPGVMYRLARRFTTVRAARKKGMLEVVEYIHAKEHRNHYLSIIHLARVVFRNQKVKIKSFPFVVPNYNLNFITKIIVTKNE